MVGSQRVQRGVEVGPNLREELTPKIKRRRRNQTRENKALLLIRDRKQ
jgi:hypothetical protein